jgi:hypothetical protein
MAIVLTIALVLLVEAIAITPRNPILSKNRVSEYITQVAIYQPDKDSNQLHPYLQQFYWLCL